MSEQYKGSILIVDDDSFVLKSISDLLRVFGFTTVTSGDPGEALERLRTEHVDIVLTDYSMPGMSGIDLLEKIRAIDEDIPVVIITGFGEDPEMIRDALNKGAFGFLYKPYKTEELVHHVGQAMEHSHFKQLAKEYKGNLENLNREMESLVAERTMSLMALTVADKVRNPSSIIAWTCKRLLEKEALTESLRGNLTDIMEEARKLEGIVRDFEVILKGRQPVFGYEDVNEIVKEIIPVIEGDAARKRVELSDRLSAERPLRVNAQKNLLRIAILHLIRNTIEATPEGGRIGIETSGDTERVSVIISSTGAFIPEADMVRIFEPFYTAKARMFGMGLAMVKQIVSEHLGDITVKSREGEGTTFTITLPVRWTENKGGLLKEDEAFQRAPRL